MKLKTLKSTLRTLAPSIASLPRWRDGRGSSAARGYDHRWRKARAEFLLEHPLCECPDCLAGERRTRLANTVHHSVPHRGNMVIFWDKSKWVAMSKACHDKGAKRREYAEYGR